LNEFERCKLIWQILFSQKKENNLGVIFLQKNQNITHNNTVVPWAALTQIILFVEMLKIFKKMIFVKAKKIVKERKIFSTI
jgi:hypothetical protein